MPKSYRPLAAALAGREPRNPHGDGRYMPALDGWRAVAIVLVMMFHAIYNVIGPVEGDHMGGGMELVSHLGALGVLIFFAISGYIITTRLYVESPDGAISLRTFYAKRCFRILPAMWTYLLVVAALGALHVIQLQRADLLAPLFLTNYFPGSSYLGHFWSLSIEEHFYLLWPVCLIVAGWRRAIYVGAGLMAVVGVYRAIRLARLGVVDAGPGVVDGARGYFLSHTEARIDYILAGCVLALLLIFYPGVRSFVQRCGSAAGVAPLLLLILISSRIQVVDLRSLQAVAIVLLVVATSLKTHSLLNRALSNPKFVFVGKLSYSLYLWQQLFLSRTSIAWLQSPIALLPRLGGAMLAAWLSYRFIERPAIRSGSEFVQRWKPAPGS